MSTINHYSMSNRTTFKRKIVLKMIVGITFVYTVYTTFLLVTDMTKYACLISRRILTWCVEMVFAWYKLSLSIKFENVIYNYVKFSSSHI